MSYRLKLDESVTDGVKRVAREQIEKALSELCGEAAADDVVHQVRKRCKKLRGLVRLVRPVCEALYKRENAWFRDAATTLSGVRDVEAMIGQYDDLMDRYDDQVERQAFASIRRRLTLLRHHADLTMGDANLRAFTGRMREALDRVAGWEVPAKGIDSIGGGLEMTYERGRVAMRQADSARTPEAFHEWRKRVKYHWYHTRLLQDLWPRMLKARRRELKRLADRLGDHHDLVVFRGRLRGSPEEFGHSRDIEAFRALIDRRLRGLENEAFRLGARLYSQKPKALAATWREWWKMASD